MTKRKDIRHITMYDTPEESPGYLLWRVSTRWRSAVEKTLKSFDLTHPQFVILATLSWLTKDGNTINQVAIGCMAGLDPNTTSQIIRKLEEKQYITRIPSSTDERSKNVMATQRGRDILARALPTVEQVDKTFFAILKENELQDMKNIFQKLMG